MKDWKAIAQAGGFEIPPKDLEKIAEPLNELEAVFRPLVKDLPVDTEPATGFHAGEDEA